MKHALLVWLLRALARKPAAFRVLDTHAGIGRYDLAGPEASRTGEAAQGIARLLDLTQGPLADYVSLVREDGGDSPREGFTPGPMPARTILRESPREGFTPGPMPAGTILRYPGSPALAAALLREQDRLALVELHEQDHATLRALFRADPRVATHRRDAWEAVRALTPFPEKRGLVLIDPPFEQPGEYERMTAAITDVNRRARGLVLAAWYPVKGRAPVRAFHTALRDSGVRDILAAELNLREPTDAARLNGCGLIVVNPPFGFEAAAEAILAALHERLSDGGAGSGWALTRLADE